MWQKVSVSAHTAETIMAIKAIFRISFFLTWVKLHSDDQWLFINLKSEPAVISSPVVPINTISIGEMGQEDA